MRSTMKLLGLTLAVLALVASTAQAEPAQIVYETTDLGGGQWEYVYTVSNLTLPAPLEEFTIWFELGSFAQLVATSEDPLLAQWDELVVQPDPVLTDDGFYDALATGAGIAPGASFAGFTVRFDWLGAGTPGAQLFEIIDPDTFETLYSGQTVPEPTTLSLLVLAALAIAGTRRSTKPGPTVRAFSHSV